jgi:hypothetical protein
MTLGLHSTVVTVAPPANPPRKSEARTEYFQDLTRPFGIEVDEELASRGCYISHFELANLLVSELPADFREPDLVILTHALPDLNQIRAVASHLNRLLGGRALSFAVIGQGLGAPFLALRIALAYAASGRCRTPVIAVLEQNTLPYRDPVVHDGEPLKDSGVLLEFAQDAGPWTVRAIREIGPAENPAERLSGLANQATCPLAVLGPWTRDVGELPFDSHRVAPGSYGTSVWRDLDRCRESWAVRHDTLLLCDTDPRSSTTYVAVLDRRRPDLTP